MTTRAILEAALAQAQGDWRRAKDELDQAHARRARTKAEWDNVVSDRRKAESDRRKSDTVWDNTIPDRRKADADRRIALVALSKSVADRHRAYTELNDAEVDWVDAGAKLIVATAERDKAISALEVLNRAQ